MKDKKHKVISLDAEKVCDKNSTLLYGKSPGDNEEGM